MPSRHKIVAELCVGKVLRKGGNLFSFLSASAPLWKWFAGMTDVEKNLDDIGTASFDIHCIYNHLLIYIGSF